MQEADREILLGFWKVHILHHADEGPVHGQWIINELRRHGYEISPDTLYPRLGRLVERGWLSCKSDKRGGQRAAGGLPSHGQYQFTDTSATSSLQQFYRITAP